ncbi:2-oxoacid:ferredoxin oxidoreductase subunit beta [Alkaliphilus oremlandii]|uniref:Thiamine pyrophosphate protein domain protein TPP-binding n=1 Tax=Alkaliphilus oremlandii (strain OhILAs) TaxID=350688 RepID=A8MFF0_ALKOO|nr:2-oxoacid:ferredoxin oxidoreductase subunit beta [Alkaliphilus oremlandii]ABW19113.1 thiamine pyrophosphate protein domain protein TPP-binding [Alkaliphilus oremlandii OhILAs]
MASELIRNNLRMDRLPHIWCPGCGHGIIMRSLAMAIENLNLDKDKVCVVSGIGCSSRSSGYMDFNTLHTTHGRALAFATGIKLANPELEVIVITGDGDCSAIGGNHLIHASRRNIGITTIVFNNNIYGMTGGQYSPTTPSQDYGTTAPYGNIDKPFDICKLADAAGATYIARGTAYHANQLIKLIEKAIENKGFSLVDAISVCPTYYGRKNKKGSAVDMLKDLKEATLDVKAAEKLPMEKRSGKLLIGEFKNIIEPEYTEEYSKIIAKYRKE